MTNAGSEGHKGTQIAGRGKVGREMGMLARMMTEIHRERDSLMESWLGSKHNRERISFGKTARKTAGEQPQTPFFPSSIFSVSSHSLSLSSPPFLSSAQLSSHPCSYSLMEILKKA